MFRSADRTFCGHQFLPDVLSSYVSTRLLLRHISEQHFVHRVKKSFDTGLVRRDEAYSKTKVMERLGISQSFWDKMLDDGLPFASVGHGRWVTGESLFRYFEKIAECKQLAT